MAIQEINTQQIHKTEYGDPAKRQVHELPVLPWHRVVQSARGEIVRIVFNNDAQQKNVEQQEAQQDLQTVQELPSFVLDEETIAGLGEGALHDLILKIKGVPLGSGGSMIELSAADFDVLMNSSMFQSEFFSNTERDDLRSLYHENPDSLTIELYLFPQAEANTVRVIVPFLKVNADGTNLRGLDFPKGTKLTNTIDGFKWIIPSSLFDGKIAPIAATQSIVDLVQSRAVSAGIDASTFSVGDIVFAEIAPDGTIATIILSERVLNLVDLTVPAEFSANIRKEPTTEATRAGVTEQNRFFTSQDFTIEELGSAFSSYVAGISYDQLGRIQYTDGQFTWLAVQVEGGIEINGLSVGWVRTDVIDGGGMSVVYSGTPAPEAQRVEFGLDGGQDSQGTKGELSPEQKALFDAMFVTLPAEIQAKKGLNLNFELGVFEWQEGGQTYRYRENMKEGVEGAVVIQIGYVELSNENHTKVFFESSVDYPNAVRVSALFDQEKLTKFFQKEFPLVLDQEKVVFRLPNAYIDDAGRVQGAEELDADSNIYAYNVINGVEVLKRDDDKVLHIALGTRLMPEIEYWEYTSSQDLTIAFIASLLSIRDNVAPGNVINQSEAVRIYEYMLSLVDDGTGPNLEFNLLVVTSNE